MKLAGKIIVVTGAASGIGRALAIAFHKSGAKKIICADIDEKGAQETAAQISGLAQSLDVSNETQIKTLINETEAEIGPIDLFCSNAGISVAGGFEASDEDWQRIWDINVMSHIYAARHLVPKMLARGGGHLLNTASAAGLLSQIGSAPYAVTKHAAVAFAEWLAITYGAQGLRVSVLCPQAVRTKMTAGFEDHVASVDGMMEAGDVADICVEAIDREDFLILPHPEVGEYFRRKADNYDRWLSGMQRLQERFGGFMVD